MSNSVFAIKNSDPKNYEIEFKQRGQKFLYYLNHVIELIKKNNFSTFKSSVVLSYKTTFDEYEFERIEFIILRINYVKTDVPQLVNTFSISYIIETQDRKEEYQFLLDMESKRVLFQAKFVNDEIEKDVKSDEFTNIRELFSGTDFKVII